MVRIYSNHTITDRTYCLFVCLADALPVEVPRVIDHVPRYWAYTDIPPVAPTHQEATSLQDSTPLQEAMGTEEQILLTQAIRDMVTNGMYLCITYYSIPPNEYIYCHIHIVTTAKGGKSKRPALTDANTKQPKQPKVIPMPGIHTLFTYILVQHTLTN